MEKNWTGLRKGLVEQRTDPERGGRIKVRVEGVHGPEVPITDLPWALPKTSAWRGGGFFCIPPLGSIVWVEFENQDPEYPVWSGGFWPEGAITPRQLPKESEWFGSQHKHDKGSLLKFDPEAVKADPINAPNVSHLTSPLGKTLAFDERKNREAIWLGDQLGNGMFVNSETGVTTFETISGIQHDGELYRGVTFSSDKKNEHQAWQFYSFAGWLVGQDDLAKNFRIQSPSRFQFSIDETRKKVEIQTPNGVTITVNDETKGVRIDTPEGRVVNVDDTSKTLTLKGASEGMYIVIDESGETPIVELRSGGNLNVLAAGAMRFASTGDMVLTSETKVRLQPNGLHSVEPRNIDIPALTEITELEKLPRAWDYNSHSQPAKCPKNAEPTV